jgi:flagellar motor switch/type III secretory pathway protein FliN
VTVELSARSVTPFPFGSLPSLSREELALGAVLRRAAREVAIDAAAATLSDLLGETVSLSLRHVRLLDPAKVSSTDLGVMFSAPEADGLSRATLAIVEPALAGVVVGQALRHRAPRVVDASRPPTPEVAGALAAVLHATLRRVHPGAPLRVIAAGPAGALARDLLRAHPRVASAWLTIVVGKDVFDARVCMPEVPRSTTVNTFTSDAALSMGDAPLAIPLVASSCIVDRVTLSSLRIGDVFVVPHFPLTTKDGALVGEVGLVAPSAERGAVGRLGEGGRLMLGSSPLGHFPWDRPHDARGGDSMSAEANATLEVLEDAPVVVRVELGVVEMRARDWAALGPGDVVTLGRKLGDPAVLRVGGVEVARGELVQVEGEYGVRILARSAGDR